MQKGGDAEALYERRGGGLSDDYGFYLCMPLPVKRFSARLPTAPTCALRVRSDWAFKLVDGPDYPIVNGKTTYYVCEGTPAARLPTRFEMDMRFDAVYYEPRAPEYPLGRELREKYSDLPWIEIESHNKIPQFSGAENRAFPALKKHLIVGVRKTHKYVENRKVSDFLVPYTSSGCRAMCLYCYLVCNYNKCAYLRLFVNREQMMGRLIKTSLDASRPLTFEIGSNSDLVMENAVTGNLPLTIESFGREGRGKITFPTKSDMVEPLLALDHKGKTIFRMSVNPDEIIRRYEIGTSPLLRRISALNDMCAAGYPVGLIIAPVILLPEWRRLYGGLIDTLAQG